jgi:hypothetical protein
MNGAVGEERRLSNIVYLRSALIAGKGRRKPIISSLGMLKVISRTYSMNVAAYILTLRRRVTRPERTLAGRNQVHHTRAVLSNAT